MTSKNIMDNLDSAGNALVLMAQEYGKTKGLLGLPKATGDSLAPHIMKIKGWHEQLLLEYVKDVGDGDLNIATLYKKKLEDRLEHLKLIVPNLLAKIMQLEGELRTLPPKAINLPTAIGFHCLIVLAAMLDSYFATNAFAFFNWSDNGSRILMMAGFTVIFAALPHFILTAVKWLKTNPYHVFISLAISTLIILWFLGMAFLRASYLQQHGKGGLLVNAAILFTVQLCLFMISIFLATKTGTKEQFQRNKAERKLVAQIKTLKAEHDRADAELKAIPEILYQKEVELNGTANDNKAQTAKIQTFYENAVAEFLEYNLLFRPDHKRPDCFDDPIPPLRSNAKHSRTTFSILLLTACSILISSCQPHSKKMDYRIHAKSVITDITDTGLVHLDPKVFANLYHYGDYLDGFLFRHRYIASAENKDVTLLKIPPANSWLFANERERSSHIDTFKGNVLAVLNDATREISTAQTNSMVYEAICKEVQALAAYDSATLYVFSDLEHHTDVFSFCREHDFALAKENPDSVIRILESICPLPSVSHVKIYLIYKPRSYSKQIRYGVAENIFSKMLSAHGNTVIVVPNIIPDE